MKYKGYVIHSASAVLLVAGFLLMKQDSLLAVSLISCTLFIYVAASVKRADKGKKIHRDLDQTRRP